MSKINEIVSDYTSGKVDVEATNAALKAAGAGFSFVPGQNELTAKEIKETKVGASPSDATGYGLMDSGTGTYDKVHVVNGVVLGGRVNTVTNGVPNETDYVYIGGKTYQVYGDKLGEVAPKGEPWWVPYHTFTGHVAWQDELDKYIPDEDMMFNRPKYHGVEVVKGAIRYIYAEDGTAKYQPKSMRDYDEDHGRS